MQLRKIRGKSLHRYNRGVMSHGRLDVENLLYSRLWNELASCFNKSSLSSWKSKKKLEK